MRLLYVAAGHPLQEADDCLMWQKMGIDWFSTGYYSQSKQPGDLPYIDHENDPHLMSLLEGCTSNLGMHDKENGPIGIKNKTFTSYNLPNIWDFTQDFLKHFDMIMICHNIANLQNIWKTLHCLQKRTPVVVKTFAMHTKDDEKKLANYRKHKYKMVFSVRNSPMEPRRYPGNVYAGHDAIIRGCVVPDEHEISGWVGDREEVVTFANNFGAGKPRRNVYIQCKRSVKYPFKLYGAGNEKESMSDGFVTHERKLDILRHARVSLTTGTPNSTNTYSFVEAWVMGLPQVVYGPSLWQTTGHEPEQLGKHGDDILIGNTPEELVKYLNMVLGSKDLAQEMSEKSREKAIKVYGRDVLAEQWGEFFDDIINNRMHNPEIQKRPPSIHRIRN